jgi:hypothetical protein
MNARALLVAGFAVHLGGLLLPFASFKCEPFDGSAAPESFFSIPFCAISGVAYLLFWLVNPTARVLLFVLECVWLAVLVAGLPFAFAGRLRRVGLLASVLLLPSFVAVVAAVSPSRLLGPSCAGLGAVLVLWGGGLSLRAQRAQKVSPERT